MTIDIGFYLNSENQVFENIRFVLYILLRIDKQFSILLQLIKQIVTDFFGAEKLSAITSKCIFTYKNTIKYKIDQLLAICFLINSLIVDQR